MNVYLCACVKLFFCKFLCMYVNNGPGGIIAYCSILNFSLFCQFNQAKRRLQNGFLLDSGDLVDVIDITLSLCTFVCLLFHLLFFFFVLCRKLSCSARCCMQCAAAFYFRFVHELLCMLYLFMYIYTYIHI